mmetsp:Transcript_105105/g.226704  ORF Transcript_105105/g.226704 Transcript_105105/m.226704 type:complete len:212 (+) Transcript_105105:711-1346(+)
MNMGSARLGCMHSRRKMKSAVLARSGEMRRSWSQVRRARSNPHARVAVPRSLASSVATCSTARDADAAVMYRARNAMDLCRRRKPESKRRPSGGTRCSGSHRSRLGARMHRGQMPVSRKRCCGPKASTSRPDVAVAARPPKASAPQQRLCRSEALSGADFESWAVVASIMTSGMAMEKLTRMKKGTVAAAERGARPRWRYAATPRKPAAAM